MIPINIPAAHQAREARGAEKKKIKPNFPVAPLTWERGGSRAVAVVVVMSRDITHPVCRL